SYIPLLGYRSRISRYLPESSGFSAPETVLETRRGDYGNFEGLDIWTDATGRHRATMITDNDFSRFRQTAVAEFRLAH
ncbi:MAG: esterase-like activity of phytase family protein, partial [Rhodobacteraceae bacterium]|nr:esterase-like activity of phytase family protein [Paracoccaceae bacterium]